MNKLIPLHDGYCLSSDKYKWILKQSYTGKDKDGNEKEQLKDLGYFRTLEQACTRLIDLESKSADSLESLITAIEDSTARIIKAIEGMK